MQKQFNPKVSIVIPVYNGSNYLEEAIDSALAQTYKNIEVIVINDGSNDNGKTDKICRLYGERIRYFSKKNGGVASALNLGVEKMEGEYFSWLSHDDVYYDNKIEKQVKFLSKIPDRKNIILFANYDLIDEKSRFIQKVKMNHEQLLEKPEYALLRCCINGITLLVPKSAFKEYGGFDVSLRCTQDYDLWKKFIKSYKFLHMDDIFTKTRIHEKQDSNNHPNVIPEGNLLWIGIMESFSLSDKIRLEGSEYNFYSEMMRFLSTETPYQNAINFAKEKMESISKSNNGKYKDIRVTVVIPFFNRLKPLLKAIDSVKKQTHDNLELLLINDGSTDDLSELIDYIRDDKRIKLIKIEENSGGPSAPRNLGIRSAKGEYIAFLDSDDEFLPEKIEEQLEKMVITGYDVSQTSYIERNKEKDQVINLDLPTGNVIPRIIKSCKIATPTVMIKTDYLRRNKFKFYEEIRIGEDTIFWLDILRDTKLLVIDKALTIVNTNEKSAATNLRKHLEGLTNILRFLFNDKEYSKYHSEIADLCIRYYQISREIFPVEENPLALNYSFWRNKPSNLIQKAIYLFKNQGILTTLKKVIKKYTRKLFR